MKKFGTALALVAALTSPGCITMLASLPSGSGPGQVRDFDMLSLSVTPNDRVSATLVNLSTGANVPLDQKVEHRYRSLRISAPIKRTHSYRLTLSRPGSKTVTRDLTPKFMPFYLGNFVAGAVLPVLLGIPYVIAIQHPSGQGTAEALGGVMAIGAAAGVAGAVVDLLNSYHVYQDNLWNPVTLPPSP